MPEQRVFGPIRGAGVQVNERVGQESIQRGRYGTTVLVGPFERGAEGDITILPGRRAFDRKMGDLLNPNEFAVPSFANLWTPLMARHFFDRGRGAGTLICLRVVPTTNNASQDDRPDKAIFQVWNREAEPKLIGQIEAHNGGAWAGKRKCWLGSLEGVPGTDFPTANQIQLYNITTKDFKYDEYRDGQVTLDGLPGISYRIVNIDPDGLITLDADQDVATDWGSGETAGSVTGTVAGPTWNLAPNQTLIIHCDEDLGGPDTATFTATQATIAGGAPAIAAMNGKTVIFTIDGGDEQTVTFTAAAVDLATTLVELNVQSLGCHWEDDGAGNIDVFSDTYGSDSEVDITGGTGLVEIGHAIATSAPTGDPVADINSVTFAEVKAIVEAAVVNPATGVTVTLAAGNYITITSGTTGAASSVQVEVASTADTALGLDNVKHDGSAGPADLDAQLVRTNVNTMGVVKACDIQFVDGALKADSEFGMIVRINGRVVLSYENLSMNPASANYWQDVVNSDPNNDVIVVTDSFTGDPTVASARPANRWGQSSVLTATRLTIADPHISGMTNQPGSVWVPSITWNSWGSEAKVQRLKVTMSDAVNFVISTDKGNRTWAGAIGGGAVAMGDHVGSITVATTSGVPVAGDYFFVYLRPLEPDELIGGRVFPNKTDASQRNQSFAIVDNSVSYVDVSDLNDLTDGGANVAGKEYQLIYPEQMTEGYDGYLAGMTTSDYERHLDIGTSPILKIQGRGYGLPTIAAPGVTYFTLATALQQKLQTLVAKYNWGCKNEIPWTYHDWDVYYEHDLVDYLNNTLGRTEYASLHFPSYGYIRDPFAESGSDARKVLVPLLGQILGDEAYVAQRYEGYHKAAAGIDVQLPDVIELPAVGRPESPVPLDEEVLNPAGINIVKWRQGGNVVILWGDRTLATSTAFRFLHKRRMLSHYEIDLQEGFDFTIFEINDPIEDAKVLAAVHDYFLPEWRKRAIRGNTFVGGENPAAIFKMDSDNNTDATRAQGDQILEISLNLADVIERLRIFAGAMGVVEGTV